MPVHRSTAYAFAPTWDGRKLPWELGRPEVRDILAELSDSEAVSSTRYSVSPTPEGLVGSLTGGQLEKGSILRNLPSLQHQHQSL